MLLLQITRLYPHLLAVLALVLPTAFAHAQDLVLPTAFAHAQDEASKRPNIVFIFSDDHSERAISAYGSLINETPNIDRLASQGVLFRNSFVTNSICVPSRATVMTGTYSHVSGQFTNYDDFDGSQPTVQQLFRDAGYTTAHIGKWHLKTDPTGFDHTERLIRQGQYFDASFLNNFSDEGRNTYPGYVTDIITEWMEEVRVDEKPFMLFTWHKAPHAPWQGAPRHETKYAGVTFPEPPTLFDDHSGRTTAAQQQQMTLYRDMLPRHLHRINSFPTDLSDEDRARWLYQRYMSSYLMTVAALDENIGRMMDYLEESGLAENTIIVYASDQGFFLGEMGMFDKRWMYEPSFRTPLIISVPGVTHGTENHDFVMNLDYAQTFLDLAGIEAHPRMQGGSLVPLLHGETPQDWRQSMYYHFYENPRWGYVARHYGVRTHRYKLIHFYEHDEWELYDLERDPNEVRSVYHLEEYASVREELKADLERLREQYQVDERGDLVADRVAAQTREAQNSLRSALDRGIPLPESRIQRLRENDLEQEYRLRGFGEIFEQDRD